MGELVISGMKFGGHCVALQGVLTIARLLCFDENASGNLDNIVAFFIESGSPRLTGGISSRPYAAAVAGCSATLGSGASRSISSSCARVAAT